jgi:hypothetical protein
LKRSCGGTNSALQVRLASISVSVYQNRSVKLLFHGILRNLFESVAQFNFNFLPGLNEIPSFFFF